MAYLIPESARRLQATALVHNEEIAAVGATHVLRLVAKNLAEEALRKMMDDCMTTESYAGYAKAIRLDVFVLSPDELFKMLAESRAQGERDAARWMICKA